MDARPKRFLSVERLEAIVARGLTYGYVKPVYPRDFLTLLERDKPFRRFRMEISSDCEEPCGFELHSRTSASAGKRLPPIIVEGSSKCRKCDNCRDRRAHFWRERAEMEYSRTKGRTWFVTLTLAPDWHYQFDAQMSVPFYTRDRRGTKRLVRDAYEISKMNARELFVARTQEIGREVTLYLKRVRKELGHFRYLIVAEPHLENPDSEVYGRTHFHALLHEYSELVPRHQSFVGKDGKTYAKEDAKVRKTWQKGWTQAWVLPEAAAAGYLCKYVSKEAMARIRASFRYGLVERRKPYDTNGE
jgi:hypothetical protein